MKQIIFFLLVFLLIPASVWAVDITDGITLLLPSSGDSYTLDRDSQFDLLTVASDNFVFELSGGQKITLGSSDKRNLTNTLGIATACGAEISSLTVKLDTGATAVSVTITPSGTCTPTTSTGGGGGIISGGGGVSAPTIPPQEIALAPSPPPAAPVAPSALFTTDLAFGMQSNDVSRLQALLASDRSVYPEGLVTGYFGRLTREAVKRFQTRYGLPQVGRAGPLTRAKLAEIFSEKKTQTQEEKIIEEIQAKIKELREKIKALR